MEKRKPNLSIRFNIQKFNLNEEINDLYIYQDNIKSIYTIYYNNEIKFPLNLIKQFNKRTNLNLKFKDFFDIGVNFDKNNIDIHYFLN